MIFKDRLRRRLLKKRSTLSHKSVISKSDQIFKKIILFREIKNADNFLIYLSKDNEVDTKRIIDYLLSRKRTILVPAFLTSEGTYKIVRFSGFDNLEAGLYQILQPKDPDLATAGLIDVVIIPGIGFDKMGTRLGYGKGVYDQLLADSPAFKIGLAYHFQVVDGLPKEAHDLVVNVIITESKIFKVT